MHTGHRIARDGIEPRQTREQPVVFWPFELARRAEARLRRHEPQLRRVEARIRKYLKGRS